VEVWHEPAGTIRAAEAGLKREAGRGRRVTKTWRGLDLRPQRDVLQRLAGRGRERGGHAGAAQRPL